MPLSRRLNVTKGSFYWHFKDRGALHEEMLAEWCRRVKSDMTAHAAGNEGNAKMRLRRFFQISLTDLRSRHDADLKLAVRLWGRRDRRVSEALAEVDRLRRHCIGQLLKNIGVRTEELAARAALAYAYVHLVGTLVAHQDRTTIDVCESLTLSK